MPDVKIETELTPKQKSRQARLKAVSDNSHAAPIKVWPATDDVRRLIRHPSGTAFRPDMGAAVEWPHDSFTVRRIRDGSVSIGGAAAQKAAEKTEGLNQREIAYARRPKEMPPMQPVSVSQQAEKKNGERSVSPDKSANAPKS